MLTDAHCHPGNLLPLFPGAEEERRRLGVACVASSASPEEFECHGELARRAAENGAPPVFRCFAVHPQLPAAWGPEGAAAGGRELLDTLGSYAAGGRLDAVGETGFDLYNGAFRNTEAVQEQLFRAHLEAALGYDLPLVLHIRRAMHKVFLYTPELRKIPAVIFHSWPGTLGEGEALLRRGINAFFSFGTTVLLNHKEARRCCASLPAERLLLETDAPWQPLRGKEFSSWADLPLILAAAAALRREAGNPGNGPAELERIVEGNFFRVFHKQKQGLIGG
ncbi:MAG: TatD family hydrolase [Treponema sp.]|jgi:TatD DNase family protein|nr:TatD family hydrolase [Treponema sp.]